MSSYWDWFEELRRYMRERIKRIEDLFNEMDAGFSIPAYSPMEPGNIEEPLYRIDDMGDSFRIMIDLPAIDPESLSVDLTEDYLVLRASIRDEAKYAYESILGRRVRVSSYTTTIKFPVPVNPQTVKAERKGDILVITVEKKR